MPPPDPSEGSRLSRFSLSTVGAALSDCRKGEAPADRERTLWSLIRAGGGERPRKVPIEIGWSVFISRRGDLCPRIPGLWHILGHKVPWWKTVHGGICKHNGAYMA